MKKIINKILERRILSGIIALALIGVVYFSYTKIFGNAGAVRYATAQVQNGTLIVSVSGSGQVSAQSQVDVQGKASGDITHIYVKSGQVIKAGTLIAGLDSRNAGISLESAQVTYEKLIKPADIDDVKSAEDNIVKSYNDGWNAVSSVFADYPSVVAGLNNLFYEPGGYLRDTSSIQRSSTDELNINRAGVSFDQAKNRYEVVLGEYNALSRLSATTSIKLLIDDTNNMLRMMAEALKNTQAAISYMIDSELDTSTAASTAKSNVNSWLSLINSHLSSTLSAQSGIISNETVLKNLIKGPDALDLRSGQLSLLQSQYSYQDYFIRAPFDGIVARVPAKVGDSASGAIIATIISDKKIAEVSLNEVDVTKVKAGQKATLTFDAVPDLTITGEVAEVDAVGTVSQGVVTYTVKIAFDTQDERVKSSMSVSAAIITEAKPNVLLVPNSAVKSQNGASYVEVPDKSDAPVAIANARDAVFSKSIRQQSVEIGTANDDFTEILNGLKEGDLIVTRTIQSTAAQPAQQQSGGLRIPGLNTGRTGR